MAIISKIKNKYLKYSLAWVISPFIASATSGLIMLYLPIAVWSYKRWSGDFRFIDTSIKAFLEREIDKFPIVLLFIYVSTLVFIFLHRILQKYGLPRKNSLLAYLILSPFGSLICALLVALIFTIQDGSFSAWDRKESMEIFQILVPTHAVMVATAWYILGGFPRKGHRDTLSSS